MLKQKARREQELLIKVLQNKGTVERWYNRTAMKLMKVKEFKDKEEKLLEFVSEFFLNELENTETELENIEKEFKEK